MAYKGYFEAKENDTEYGGAKEIVEKEIEHIKSWRGKEPQAGIALSGGGIRSASYGLGVLQALAYGRWLPKFDYLSTVSGGGYIGSSLSYLLHCSQSNQSQNDHTVEQVYDVSCENFPYLSHPMVGTRTPEEARHSLPKGLLLRRLRQNAKYLTPGDGITLLSLIGVVVRNSVTSVLVHVGVLVLFFLFLIGTCLLDVDHTKKALSWGGNTMLIISVAIFGVYVSLSALYVFATGFFDLMIRWMGANAAYRARHWTEQSTHWILWAGISTLILAALPWVHQWLGDETGRLHTIGAGVSISGILGSVWAYLQTSSTKKPKVPTGLIVAIASALLFFGVLLLAYHYAEYSHAKHGGWWGELIGLAVFLVFLGWIPNVNYLSVHRYYRDRLMETFMPEKEAMNDPDQRIGLTRTGNKTMMGELCGIRAKVKTASDKHGPYHLINTNVVLVSSKKARFKGRGGDNFIFSPLFTGSNATGWKWTDPCPESGVTLATAMAISGAAVNPNTGCGGEGITRQPVLSVLMSLLNIRLGYWFKNPRYTTDKTNKDPFNPVAAGKTAGQRQAATDDTNICGRPKSLWSTLKPLFVKPNMIYPGMVESFNRFILHEDMSYVLLSDGGHFENLGLYELVRRRLKLIIVCDGAADPTYGFADLANAIEKVRADFGAIIDITSDELDILVPHRPDHYPEGDASIPVAARGYLLAPIRYAPRKTGASPGGAGNKSMNEESGLLIYLTTTFFKKLSADLHGYRQSHPEFPDEPTSDQFFDEKQFEAYRELGYQTARCMMLEASGTCHGDFRLNGVDLPKVKEGVPC